MKQAYPVIMTQGNEFLVVYVPDFNINTQGKNYVEAMEMAQDAIGLVGIDMEDEQEPLPEPTPISELKAANSTDIITLVDVDFEVYRRKQDH